MIHIENYIHRLITSLQDRFGDQLLYVGLQGSHLRHEATPDSDIDIMVILDTLTVADLDAYRTVIQSMEHYDKFCGFICSKEDLSAWNPLEIFHLLHSTKDYYGTLFDYIPTFTELDIRNFVKLSLNNLYHELCHRYIHADPDRNNTALPQTYKGVFFILQDLYYLTAGEFIPTKAELLTYLEGKNRAVLDRSMALNRGCPFDFRESFELLLTWCQDTLQTV